MISWVKSDRARRESPVKKTTLKDIAQEAGVSVGAVSLILNNRPCRISEENKQKVREIAARRNYVANQVARALVTQRSHTLGLILPDIGDHFFSALAQRLEKKCRELGYYLMFANSDDCLDTELQLISSFGARGVDGLFVIQSNQSYAHPHTFQQALSQLSVPYIMVDRSLDHPPCDVVRYDNILGGQLATQHLLQAGHRDIACIYMDDGLGNGAHRLQGFRSAMEQAGLTVPPDRMIPGNNRPDSGERAAYAILDSRATAVFVCNGMMALGLLRALHQLGVCVPEDLSVVSYDNVLQEYLMDVQLTTVVQDLDAMAQQAATLMARRIDGELEDYVQLSLSPTLQCRDSVRPPR